MKIREILTVFFLAFSSWKDWKQKEISLFLTVIYGIVGLGVSICTERAVTDWMLPVGFACVILAVSILTSGEIGLGDGWMFVALGTMLTTESFVKTTCIGMLAAAVYAGIMLVVLKKGRKTEIPLIPFLLLGYILGGIWT